jgi:uroporphyrinogen III methyltransferase/synthase
MHDDSQQQTRGRIVFIGAGPGHPDLLTVRAAAWLRRADVVVHDALVSAEILAGIDAATELVPVPRGGDPEIDPGAAVGRLLVELAAPGRTVVRLKGGDPSVFARMAEEMQPVRDAGLAFEIVPGVTAALAAAAAAGIPLTSRSTASTATLVTGHEADEKKTGIDFAAVTGLPGTLVIYMGVDQVDKWSRELIDAGKAGDTPVTIVSRCSWPDQQIAFTTLARCAADFDRHRWQAPAVAIVGEVARGAVMPANAAGPLSGRRVLIPRAAGQGDDTAQRIAAAGGTPVAVPAIRIEPPTSWEPVDDALRRSDSFDWIVFSSVNGARVFCDRMRAIDRDARWLGTARLAAVGPATAAALADAGYRCDLVPTEFRAEGLSAALAMGAGRMRFLLLRAERGRDLLHRELAAAGHDVTDVVAYRSTAIETLDARSAALLAAGPIDWIVVTSPAVAEAAHGLFGERLSGWQIATISPLTSAAVRELGLPVAAEAAEATGPGLVRAMAEWELAHPAESR